MQLDWSSIIRNIETGIPTAMGVVWSGLTGWQMIATKLKRPKCIICGWGVSHEDQAEHVRAPCHQRCHYMAHLVSKNEDST
jgi:hypothetical protein